MKTPKPARPRLSATISREVMDALTKRALAHDLPMGRVLDQLLRPALKLPAKLSATQ